MIRTSTTLVGLLYVTAAYSQAPTSAPAPPKAVAIAPTLSYCVSGSSGYMTSDAAGDAAIAGCSRGDTIVLPGGNTYAVARVCDFTKAIVTVGGTVVCSIIVPARGKK